MVEELKREDEKGGGFLELVTRSNSPVSDISSETKPCAVAGRRSGPARRSRKSGWTEEEDERLTRAVQINNGKNWKKIATSFPGRTDVQCLHRWQKVLNPELVKGPWTKEEDDIICEQVNEHGSKSWSVIAKSLNGRIGKQCRERWHNHLNPEIKKDAWTTEEEVALIRCHQRYGNKWAEIAKFLPGRADNSIKNHWNCSVKKRLETILASGLHDHPEGIATADFSTDAGQARCQKTDPPKNIGNQIQPDQKLTTDVLFITSNMDMVHHSTIPDGLNLDLQLSPPGDSNWLRVQKQPAPETNFKLTSGEVEPILQEDPKCAILESHYHKPVNRDILDSPRRLQENIFERDDLAAGIMSSKFKETTSSSLPAFGLSESDRAEGDNHVFTTPPYCANGNLGPLSNSSPQLADTDVSISSKRLSSSEDYAQKTNSPIPRSAPPNLSIPIDCFLSNLITTLRSKAKDFEVPSIIRKRGRESSGSDDENNAAEVDVLFVRSKTMKSALEHQPWSSGQVDLSRTDSLNDHTFRLSHDHVTSETPGITKSVARRLEDEFDMEKDGSSLGVK